MSVHVVVQEPGRVPETKSPIPGRFGVERLLLELQLCRPAGTVLIVCATAPDYFTADSGPETLSIFRAMFPRLARKLEREVRAEHDKFEALRAKPTVIQNGSATK